MTRTATTIDGVEGFTAKVGEHLGDSAEPACVAEVIFSDY